ncbi:MAG: type II toxin-antitoxin system VapC family toxin [Selenomonadaceae bacterium]|nr:type II toxin-antitoxin system VapC family toxin [Selenomonadaceae bacterium]
MKLLIDTHIIIWLYEGNKKLSAKARDMITDLNNEIYFSTLSIFEIELKHKNNPENMPHSGEEIISYCKTFGFKPLTLELNHVLTFKTLKRKEGKPLHKDPFDNLLLAQAVAEEMMFITHDEHIAEYDSENIFKV